MTAVSRRRRGGHNLPAFSALAETVTYKAAMTSPWSTRRTYHGNRMIKKLKNNGVWAKITHLWVVGDVEADLLINMRNPGTNNLTKVGATTFTALFGSTVAATANYYETGIVGNTLDVNNVSMGFWTDTKTASATSDMGFLDGTGGLIVNTLSGTQSGGRAGGATVAGIATDGDGLTAVSRTNSANYIQSNRGQESTLTQASAAFTLTNTIQILKLGGQAGSFSVRRFSAAFVGTGLTALEVRHLYAAVQTFLETMQQGEPIITDQGIGPKSVTGYQHVVYGTTLGAIAVAHALARKGETVCLVGGYRDHAGNIGGMSCNGLGAADFDSKPSLGGISRSWIERARAIGGQSAASNSFYFVPKWMLQTMRETLDASKALNGYDIPIYYTGGVVSATVTNKRLTSFRTADGKVFSGFSYFADESYESDLMATIGHPMAYGREASGSGGEASNGFRNLLTTANSNVHQFQTHAAVLANVDPYNTPATPGSGLLPGVIAIPATATGASDTQVQSYNYRMTMTTTSTKRVTISSTAPTGYSVTTYEPLLRLMALDVSQAMSDITLDNSLYAGLLDVNSQGGMGTDRWGSGTAYAAAGSNYAAREVVIQDVQKYSKGLWYLLLYDADARIPAALRTAALTRGYARDHYIDPYPGDDYYFPGQIYVREFRRMVTPFILTGSDLVAVDGTTPRSVKTISTICYGMDSHHMQMMCDPAVPRIWNEGNLFVSQGGVDAVSPVPYEVITPDPAYIENGVCCFGISATHMAFGPYRMEFSFTQAAQSGGLALWLARTNSNARVQDISYASLSTELGATPEVVKPVLPVIN